MNTYSLLTYASENGRGIAGGASTVKQLVETRRRSWTDYHHFDFMHVGSLQGLAYSNPRDLEVVANNTGAKLLAMSRHDLHWLGWNSQTVENEHGVYGSSISDLPLQRMGSVGRSGEVWGPAQRRLEEFGYRQDAVNAERTAGGEIITNPYYVSLNRDEKTFRILADQMDVTSVEYQEFYTDYAASLINRNPAIDGMIIQPVKLQFWRRRPITLLDILKKPNFIDLWKYRYSFDNRGYGAYGCVKGSIEIARRLKAKLKPGKVVIYSPRYLTVGSWRNSSTRWAFRQEFNNKNGTSGDDAADNWWRDELLKLSGEVDGFVFPTDGHELDFTPEWLDAIRRNLGIWIEESPAPQLVRRAEARNGGVDE